MKQLALTVALGLAALLVRTEVLSQESESVVGNSLPERVLSNLTDEGIWELRIYTINRGRLDDFINAWRDSVYPLRHEYGFEIPAAWVVREENQFVWILGYDGPLSWENAQAAYYGSTARKTLENDPVPFIARTENLRISAVK